MHISRPGCLHRPLPLGPKTEGCPDRPPPHQFPALVWFSATTLLPLLCLSHLSPELPHQPSTRAQPRLCGLQADWTLRGSLPGMVFPPLAPDPTLSPAPQQSVSLELPQKASSGLPLPAQMKMVLPATHPRTTLSSEQN